MDQGDVLLSEILQAELQEQDDNRVPINMAPASQPEEDESEGKPKKAKALETHSQWALGGNGRFSPVGATVGHLPAGIYEPFVTPGAWGVERLSVASDGIYELPDMATETVMAEVRTFWDSEEKYRRHGLLYRRGVLLWGDPGSGKTITVKLLMNELVKRDGLVLLANNIQMSIMALKAIKRIEGNRNLIVVMEDIDEIIAYNGESAVLSMLDGEHNIDRALYLATTNFPGKLGARIINRPSRFDRRILVGMPSDAARKTYLEKATAEGLNEESLAKWVGDTNGMSIAHLRELVAAVYCLDQPYDDVIERLRAMQIQPKDDPNSGFRRANSGVGFAQKKPPQIID